VRLLAEIALVAVAAVGISVCLAQLPGGATARWRRARTSEPPRPGQLIVLERLVASAGSSSLHAHAYLRPMLVDIASYRLAAHGQTLDRMPDPVGRDLLGDGLWDLVRPGRPFPEDRHGAGVSTQQLRAMLDMLARL
jgi:hypothetical protein